MQALTIVLPILAIVAIGYGLRWRGIIRSSWVTTLNGYVYFIALPALIISSQISLDLFHGHVIEAVGWNWIFLAVASLLCVLVLRVLPFTNRLRQAVYVSATVGNSVYLGIPMVTRALDASAGSGVYATLVLLGVMQLMGAITFALLGIEFMGSGRFNARKVARNIIRNPLLLSVLAGVLLSLLPQSDFVNTLIKVPLTMIAATASPVALITLGAFMRGEHSRQNPWALTFVSIYKLMLLPLLAWCTMQVAHIELYHELATVMYSSMPVAVTAFVLSKQYKLDSAFVAVAMLVTTLLSAVSVGLVISLLH